MKRADNNEIDLLLLSLARRESDESSLGSFSAPEDEDRGFSDHLDADELNSYAEGVMPAPARARYAEHLAECGKCRRIVIGLTQATGIANRPAVLDQQSEFGFWNKLATLFTPPVLRYAVPALILSSVIAISLLVLRQQRRPEFVAQNQPADSSSPSNELKQIEPRATEETAPAQQKATASSANTSSAFEKKNLPEDKSKLAQAPAAAPDANVTTAPAMKDSPHAGQASGAAEPPAVFGREPPAPATPVERPALNEAAKVMTSKEQTAEREAQERQREEHRDQRDETSGPNRSASAKTAARSSSAGRMGGLAGVRGGPSKDKKDSNDEVETRMVSGRRFRHEGNAWVDTAYESSRATINVARGSEHFRSLVADEPGIRAIAEQLAGEVIVVWKGRAYRIN